MGKLFTISVAVFAATGSFLFGYDQGVMTDGQCDLDVSFLMP